MRNESENSVVTPGVDDQESKSTWPTRAWGVFLFFWFFIMLLLGVVYSWEFVQSYSLVSFRSNKGLTVIGKGILGFACFYFSWRSIRGAFNRLRGKGRI